MVAKTKSNKKKVLTKEEEEAKSQAYINKLLAQEQEAEDIYSLNYYEGYGNALNSDYEEDYDNDDDYDYDYGSNKKSNNNKNRRKAKHDDDDYEFSGSNKRKTVKKAVVSKKKRRQEEDDKSNINTEENSVSEEPKKTENHRVINNPLGTYSPEEEQRFLEGIELYGRDWKNLTNYIGTRNSKSVRSHAQKHFIKLYREAKPLPPKVRETGSGYTLSGKPLDPYSASAKPYLANVDIEEIERKIALFNGNKGQDDDEKSNNKIIEDKKENTEKDTKMDKNKINDDKTEPLKNNKDTEAVNENTQKKVNSSIPKKEVKPKKEANNKKININRRTKSQQALMDSIVYDEDGRTLYSKQRPKRSTASKNLNYKEYMDSSNPLTMVKCESYYGIPGSGTPGSQPFSIIVNPIALATMDLHSHLVKTEVIGLLAGEWNLEEKKLYVLSAYPCKSIENDENTEESMNRHVNVEMDPIGEFEIRNEINKLNMKVVGWYHSHPKFAPDPSFVDIENQLNYQNLFREKNNIDEPFVGVIVGPYDPRLPRSYSAVNWFYVANHQEEFGHPKHLITKTEWTNKDKNNIPVKEYEKMKNLINNYKDHMERHIFTETWKQNLEETKLEKVIKSLSYQLQLLNTGNNGETSEDLKMQKDETLTEKIDNLNENNNNNNNNNNNDPKDNGDNKIVNNDINDNNNNENNENNDNNENKNENKENKQDQIDYDSKELNGNDNDNDNDKISDTSSVITFSGSNTSELSSLSSITYSSPLNSNTNPIIISDDDIKDSENTTSKENNDDEIINENKMDIVDTTEAKDETIKISNGKEEIDKMDIDKEANKTDNTTGKVEIEGDKMDIIDKSKDKVDKLNKINGNGNESNTMDIEEKIEKSNGNTSSDNNINKMDIEENIEKSKDGSLDYYDGINLLKMVEEEIKKRNYD